MTDTALPVMESSNAHGLQPVGDPLRDYVRKVNKSHRKAISLLAQRFGVTAVRPLQFDAIEASLDGKDSLCILPTGGGKSLCYQLPALMGSGLTIVVTPLIALMKDQVDALRAREFPAACIHSDVFHRDHPKILDEARNGRLRLLYVSPERCEMPAFIEFLDRCKLRAFVIDEAHCVSVWGYDFRPSYAKLIQLRVLHPMVPIHAFTATATPRVREQIVQMLGMRALAGEREFTSIVGDFDRPNLFLSVLDRDQKDPDAHLVELLRAIPASLRPSIPNRQSTIDNRQSYDGIIYANTRAETERVATMLVNAGFSARCYHAGLTPDQRRHVQDWFMSEPQAPARGQVSEPRASASGSPSIDNRQSAIGNSKIVVATIAFGMGLNKPDVRFVIHYGMPSSIDMYHQEIGRAGRDGRPAHCVMLWHRDDYANWVGRIENDEKLTERMADGRIEALSDLASYIGRTQYDAKLSRCRHAHLVEYFGQEYVAPPLVGAGRAQGGSVPNQNPDRKGGAQSSGCGMCDVCGGGMSNGE